MSNSTTTSNVITCKAAVVYGAGEELKVEEIRVDPPKKSEVRIKMICASLCHTDILYINGFPTPLFPRVVGHEGVGVVESIGEGVTEVEVGDTVMPTYLGECRVCENCKSENSNMCHVYPPSFATGLMLDGTFRMSTSRGDKLYHHFSCSTLSEYTVINVNYIVKVDPRIPPSHASFLSCGYTTGFGSTWRGAAVHKGSSVAVLGLGAVGLGAVEGARVQGAGKIIGVDTNEWKHEKGKAFGMTEFINPSEHSDKSMSELIKDATGGLDVDYCFECTGVASFVAQALESTKAGIGTAVIIGAGVSAEINIVPLLYGRTLKGCIFGGVRTRSDLPTILDKCMNKELNLDELSTHQSSLNEINEALKTMKQRDCVKVVIQF